jgi:hypothetical protein
VAATPARPTTVLVASRARVRSGVLRIAVRAPRGATVRATVRSGSTTYGTARATRGQRTLRVRLARSLLRSVRRAGTRRAVVVVTIRDAGRARSFRRPVTLVA